ncbi:MAG TPA: 6-phosphogluconolactonase [Anaerolineales bacterium]
MAGLEPDARVFSSQDALFKAAAVVFVDAAAEAVGERGRFLVCLSGGTTPQGLYALLAQSPQRDSIDWTRVHAFWGDERCVPPEDLNSNYRTAADLLLSRVPIPSENIHRVRTELEPELAAGDYALTLRRFAEPPYAWPRFDLVLLGLGEDGHTASLFPGAKDDYEGPTLAVRSSDSQRPGWRVTLTPPVFNAARRILFLVHGAGKSKVVADVLYGGRRPELLPAQQIRPADGELIWMLDNAAAAR